MTQGLLDGRVAIVTGGASGIGQATARALAAQGAVVARARPRPVGATALVDELAAADRTAAAFAIDLADSEAIAPAVEQVVDRFGRVDVLVNSAGMRGVDPEKGRAGLFDLDVETWDLVQAVNLRAPFLLTQAVARHMIDQGDGRPDRQRQLQRRLPGAGTARCTTPRRRRGWARSPAPLRPTWAATASPSTRWRRASPAPRCCRSRRPTRSSISVRAKGPLSNLLGEVAEPEDIASVIVFLCLPSSRQITGQTIHASAGFIV